MQVKRPAMIDDNPRPARRLRLQSLADTAVLDAPEADFRHALRGVAANGRAPVQMDGATRRLLHACPALREPLTALAAVQQAPRGVRLARFLAVVQQLCAISPQNMPETDVAVQLIETLACQLDEGLADQSLDPALTYDAPMALGAVIELALTMPPAARQASLGRLESLDLQLASPYTFARMRDTRHLIARARSGAEGVPTLRAANEKIFRSLERDRLKATQNAQFSGMDRWQGGWHAPRAGH